MAFTSYLPLNQHFREFDFQNNYLGSGQNPVYYVMWNSSGSRHSYLGSCYFYAEAGRSEAGRYA